MAKKAASKKTGPAKAKGKPAKTQRRQLAPAAVRTDGNIQRRVQLSGRQVEDMRDVLREPPEEGQPLPELDPVDVFEDSDGNLWLADGFHRHEAYRLEGRKKIPAVVHQGSLRDAQKFALKCNAKSILPRTIEDKRATVEFVLGDPEWSGWSDREIARNCSVSNTFVGAMRSEWKANLNVNVDIEEEPEKRKYIDRYGNESERSATNKRQPAAPPSPAEKPPANTAPAPSAEEFAQGDAEGNWVCKKDKCDWSNPPDAEQCILCGHKRPEPKKAAAKAEGNGKHEPQEPPEPPRDLVGNVVPEALREEWEAHQELHGKASSLFNQLTETINRLASSPLGVCLAGRLSRRGAAGKDFWRSTHLENARTDVTFERPHSSLCPYCVGEGRKKPSKDCKVCEGRGWVPRFAWDGAPPEYRAQVERTAQVVSEGGGA